MEQAIRSSFDTSVAAAEKNKSHACIRPSNAILERLRISVHGDLATVEREWRAFEQHACGTVFQKFDWLATWQHHIGMSQHVKPVVVVGRDETDHAIFLLPLAIREIGSIRRLEWLGSDLCDYNAPLLADDFAEKIDQSRFAGLWQKVVERLKAHPDTQYDLVLLEKMPAFVGSQPNFLVKLRTTLNPSGAYLTHLGGNWETYYKSKRSSVTRGRERTKMKRLSAYGAVTLVNPESHDERTHTLGILIEQKSRYLIAMGVADLFTLPAYRDFYLALVTNASMKSLVHVSRLDVGAQTAAANIGLTFRGRYYHLLASYNDDEISRFGPGAIHLRELLRQAIARGFQVFDFTIGDEPYKRDWSDERMDLYDHIAAVNARGLILAVPTILARRIKRTIKQTPLLWQIFSRARVSIGLLHKLKSGI